MPERIFNYKIGAAVVIHVHSRHCKIGEIRSERDSLYRIGPEINLDADAVPTARQQRAIGPAITIKIRGDQWRAEEFADTVMGRLKAM